MTEGLGSICCWSYQRRVFARGAGVRMRTPHSMAAGLFGLAITLFLTLQVTSGLTQHYIDGVLYITPQHWKVCERFVKRHTCVVDGDTVWYEGTKMRLLGIDTPEIDGKCERERQLAAVATRALTALLNEGVHTIEAHGLDRYRRTLVTIRTDRGDVVRNMIAGGFAMAFGNADKLKWCR